MKWVLLITFFLFNGKSSFAQDPTKATAGLGLPYSGSGMMYGGSPYSQGSYGNGITPGQYPGSSFSSSGGSSFDEVAITSDYQIMSLLSGMKEFPRSTHEKELEKHYKKDKEQLISNIDQTITQVISKIPESSLKRGLKTYLEIINAKSYGGDSSVGGSNNGINIFNDNIVADNPCFAKLAEAFYKDISKQDKDLKKINGALHRPNLSIASGLGIYKDLKPGWLLDKALEYTNGDANLAYSMIGLCGHDDTAHGSLTYGPSALDDAGKVEYLRVLDDLIKGNDYDNDYKKKLEDFKNSIVDGKIKLPPAKTRKIPCPGKTSSFYLAKALGFEADLSDEYKTKIGMIQAPTKGMSVLPSKNYHFMGAAFMTCQLIGKGVSPEIAQAIEKIASWSYRTIRINAHMSESIKRLNILKTDYAAYVVKNRASRLNFDDWTFQIYKSDYADRELSKKEQLDEFNRWRNSLDTAEVLDDMTFGGGKIFGFNIPNTNLTFSFSGDPITKKIELIKKEKTQEAIKNPEKDKFNNPMKWPTERYEKAHNKALTYLMDWDWTVWQHTIGANFSAKTCKKKPANYTPDQDACAAFDKMPGNTCNINYSQKIVYIDSVIPQNTPPAMKTVTELTNNLEKILIN